MRKSSFSPIGTRQARLLILGSMPGEASLNAREYYAHPRNAFWQIMGSLFGAGPEVPYERRVAILEDNGIAVWDVLESCVREGSLDTSICEETPNDFGLFFKNHPKISRVFFNGTKAETSFNKHIAPTLEKSFKLHRLPSTSPAHAGKSLDQKLREWSKIKECLE